MEHRTPTDRRQGPRRDQILSLHRRRPFAGGSHVARLATGRSRSAPTACRMDRMTVWVEADKGHSWQQRYAGHSRGVISTCPRPFDATGEPFDGQLAVTRARYPATPDPNDVEIRLYNHGGETRHATRTTRVHIGESPHRPCRRLVGLVNPCHPHPHPPPQTRRTLGLRPHARQDTRTGQRPLALHDGWYLGEAPDTVRRSVWSFPYDGSLQKR